jgi:hypothetical protein
MGGQTNCISEEKEVVAEPGLVGVLRDVPGQFRVGLIGLAGLLQPNGATPGEICPDGRYASAKLLFVTTCHCDKNVEVRICVCAMLYGGSDKAEERISRNIRISATAKQGAVHAIQDEVEQVPTFMQRTLAVDVQRHPEDGA